MDINTKMHMYFAIMMIVSFWNFVFSGIIIMCFFVNRKKNWPQYATNLLYITYNMCLLGFSVGCVSMLSNVAFGAAHSICRVFITVLISQLVQSSLQSTYIFAQRFRVIWNNGHTLRLQYTKGEKKNIFIFNVCLFVFSHITVGPYFLASELEDGVGKHVCGLNVYKNTRMMFTVSSLLISLPHLINITIFAVLYCRFWKHAHLSIIPDRASNKPSSHNDVCQSNNKNNIHMEQIRTTNEADSRICIHHTAASTNINRCVSIDCSPKDIDRTKIDTNCCTDVDRTVTEMDSCRRTNAFNVISDPLCDVAVTDIAADIHSYKNGKENMADIVTDDIQNETVTNCKTENAQIEIIIDAFNDKENEITANIGSDQIQGKNNVDLFTDKARREIIREVELDDNLNKNMDELLTRKDRSEVMVDFVTDNNQIETCIEVRNEIVNQIVLDKVLGISMTVSDTGKVRKKKSSDIYNDEIQNDNKASLIQNAMRSTRRTDIVTNNVCSEILPDVDTYAVKTELRDDRIIREAQSETITCSGTDEIRSVNIDDIIIDVFRHETTTNIDSDEIQSESSSDHITKKLRSDVSAGYKTASVHRKPMDVFATYETQKVIFIDSSSIKQTTFATNDIRSKPVLYFVTSKAGSETAVDIDNDGVLSDNVTDLDIDEFSKENVANLVFDRVQSESSSIPVTGDLTLITNNVLRSEITADHGKIKKETTTDAHTDETQRKQKCTNVVSNKDLSGKNCYHRSEVVRNDNISGPVLCSSARLSSIANDTNAFVSNPEKKLAQYTDADGTSSIKNSDNEVCRTNDNDIPHIQSKVRAVSSSVISVNRRIGQALKDMSITLVMDATLPLLFLVVCITSELVQPGEVVSHARGIVLVLLFVSISFRTTIMIMRYQILRDALTEMLCKCRILKSFERE